MHSSERDADQVTEIGLLQEVFMPVIPTYPGAYIEEISSARSGSARSFERLERAAPGAAAAVPAIAVHGTEVLVYEHNTNAYTN